MDEYKTHKGGKGFDSRASYERAFHSGAYKWDYIARIICIGCGKTLSDYDNLHGFAMCLNCRKVLFPETIHRDALPRKRSPARY